MRAINDKFGVSEEEHAGFQKESDEIEDRVGEVVWRAANPFTESKQARCYKGITTVKIFHGGSVRFCWTSRDIGNLFEKSFSEIWTSEEARSMRKFIRDRYRDSRKASRSLASRAFIWKPNASR